MIVKLAPSCWKAGHIRDARLKTGPRGKNFFNSLKPLKKIRYINLTGRSRRFHWAEIIMNFESCSWNWSTEIGTSKQNCTKKHTLGLVLWELMGIPWRPVWFARDAPPAAIWWDSGTNKAHYRNNIKQQDLKSIRNYVFKTVGGWYDRFTSTCRSTWACRTG